MKVKRETWRVAVLSAVATGLVGPSAAVAQEYALTVLSPPPGKVQPRSHALDLNAQGQVVGMMQWQDGGGIFHAVLWSHGRVIDLHRERPMRSLSWAFALNDAGVIVGQAQTCDNGCTIEAFLWDGERLVNLGERLGDGRSQADDINERGEVVGQWAKQGDNWSRPVLWGLEETHVLPDLGGRGAGATAINERSEIAGIAENTDQRVHAVLWRDKQVIDLGTLGGDFSAAYDINDPGVVVGGARGNDGRIHPFLWDGEMHDLGTLGGNHGNARGLNSHNEVVGFAQNGDALTRPFLWNGKMIDLTEHVPERWRESIEHAENINDAGQIIGKMVLSEGSPRGYILTPTTCRGFVTCDANCDGSVDLQDVEPFIMALLDAEQYADEHPTCNWLCNLDANRDGEVDLRDVEAFIECLLG